MRHAKDGKVNERAFSSLSIQPKENSQVGGYKGKKPWKNKQQKKHYVKQNEKPNVIVKNNGSKGDCKICANLHFGDCWFKSKVSQM